MLGYGRDESVPTPNGMFAPHFVGERWYFTECSLRISRIVHHVIADRSQP